MNNIDLATIRQWQSSTLLRGIEQAVLDDLSTIAHYMDYKAGDFFYYENDKPDYFYIILSGKAEILKEDLDYPILELSRGEYFGNIAVFRRSSRTETVRAVTDVKVVAFHMDEIARLKNTLDIRFVSRISLNYCFDLESRINHSEIHIIKILRIKLQHANARLNLSRLLFYIMILMFTYILAFTIFQNMKSQLGFVFVFNNIMILVFLLISFQIIKRCGYSYADYGLSFYGCKYAIKDAILWSLVVIAIMTFVKWFLIHFVHGFHQLSLISFWQASDGKMSTTIFAIVLYCILAPLQELMARGVLQGVLQRTLFGPHSLFWAIVISNMIFTCGHLHMGIMFGILTFLPGLFWGWMYSRHKTIVGVSVSHILIGVWAFFVLDSVQALIS